MKRTQAYRWASLFVVAGLSALGTTAIHSSWANPAAAPAAAPPAAGAPARAASPPAANQPVTRPPIAGSPALGVANGTIADVAERVVSSVVNLSVTRTRKAVSGRRGPDGIDPRLRDLFGPGGPEQPGPQDASLGSGVIVGADGLILTSAHVVDGADRVEITLHDGREVDGTVAGTDPRSDLAVVRIDKKDANGLVALPMGDSTKLRLGEVVLAIGNPFGVGQTVTMGIVSGTRRSGMGIVDYEDFIQTDAAINPGNSGGALVDMRGQLVGINTAILSRSGGNQGIGFAIPTSMIGPIMKSLVATGSVQRGWLGIAIQEVDRDLGQALGLTAGDGVLVADVEADTPAARAGLHRGDVIRSVEGEKMKSSSQLRNKVASLAPGANARLEVVRDGKPQTVDVRLGTLPDDEAAAAGRPSRRGDRDRSQGDGVVSEGVLGGAALRPLTDGLRRRLQLSPRIKSGVVIAAVELGSGADRLGLRPGDVVVEVDRSPVRDPAQLRALSKSARDAVAVVVVRDGRTIYLAGQR